MMNSGQTRPEADADVQAGLSDSLRSRRNQTIVVDTQAYL